jgi:hypothetical protein
MAHVIPHEVVRVEGSATTVCIVHNRNLTRTSPDEECLT